MATWTHHLCLQNIYKMRNGHAPIGEREQTYCPSSVAAATAAAVHSTGFRLADSWLKSTSPRTKPRGFVCLRRFNYLRCHFRSRKTAAGSLFAMLLNEQALDNRKHLFDSSSRHLTVAILIFLIILKYLGMRPRQVHAVDRRLKWVQISLNSNLLSLSPFSLNNYKKRTCTLRVARSASIPNADKPKSWERARVIERKIDNDVAGRRDYDNRLNQQQLSYCNNQDVFN